MPTEINGETFYTYQEVAEETGYSEGTIRNMANSVEGYQDISEYKIQIDPKRAFLEEDVLSELNQ